jgi:hypothetical protein
MLQKFRADTAGKSCSNGAVPWYTKWVGGPSLALIRNCPSVINHKSPRGDYAEDIGPRSVYIRGEADTFFTQPAVCRYKGKDMRGYVTCTDGNWEFHIPKQD